MTKSKKKKLSKSNTEKNRPSQNESLDVVTSKIPLDSNDENSSDSNSSGLHIDSEEESSKVIRSYYNSYQYVCALEDDGDVPTVQIQSKENYPTASHAQGKDNGPTTAHVQRKDNVLKEVFNEQKEDASNVEQSGSTTTAKQIQQLDKIITEIDNTTGAAVRSQSNAELNKNKQSKNILKIMHNIYIF